MIEIEYTEKKSNTVPIDEALHAYKVVQLLKEEVVLMENEAHRRYRIADELFEQGNKSKSTFEREIGNALMRRVVNLKQIME